MKIYLVSLGAGILVGVIYTFLHVRSPAPPAIALIGLLGMLIGEQILPTAQRMLAGEPITMAWFKSECIPKITGAPATPVENEAGAGTATVSGDDSGAKKS
jgi:XapX domain-containing protein